MEEIRIFGIKAFDPKDRGDVIIAGLFILPLTMSFLGALGGGDTHETNVATQQTCYSGPITRYNYMFSDGARSDCPGIAEERAAIRSQIENPIPKPTPVASNNYIFDIDTEAGIILYERGDCVIMAMINTGVNEESGICVGDDWDNFRKGIKKIKPIVETPKPTHIPIYTPVTTPIPIVSTDKPFENAWDFIEYVQKNWKYEYDTPGKVVQEPTVSLKLLSGDCDDFATMVAYYLQEVYGYDTVILRVHLPEGDHFVAFLQATEEVTQKITDNCNMYLPMWERNGKKYIPIDWQICPEWTWTGPEGTKIYSKEWSDFVGKVY